MAGGQAVICAGFGFASSASVIDLAEALAEAQALAGVAHLDALAIRAAMSDPSPAQALARHLAVPLMMVPATSLAAMADLCQTRSRVSLDHTGLPSVAEAAALAGAGAGARLIQPRLVRGVVTCALAGG